MNISVWEYFSTVAKYMLIGMLCSYLSPLAAQVSGERVVLKYDQNNVPLDSVTARYLSMSDEARTKHSLEDVVVVAYGRSRKRDLTGAISSITSKDIEGLPTSNLIGALEGTTGVLIQNTNGQVGHEGVVFVRGFTSANGTNEPLYVVDGTEFYGSLNDINPEDIESISVLKDAAALALYGARAGNGVILIAMKTGRRSKFIHDDERFEVRAVVKQGLYNRGMRDYKRLGAEDWMYWQYQGLLNSNVTNGMSRLESVRNTQQNLINNYMGYNIWNTASSKVYNADGTLASGVKMLNGYVNDRDWEKALLQVGYRQEYELSGSRVSERSNSYLSLGYLNETGYVKNTDYSRVYGRVYAAYRPLRFLEFSMASDVSYQNSSLMRQTQDNPSNIISFMRNVAPIYPIHQHNEYGDYLYGTHGNTLYDASVSRPFLSQRNPVWELEDLSNKYTRTTIISRPSLSIYLPHGLSVSTFSSFTYFNQQDRDTYGREVGEWKGIGMTNHESNLTMTRMWNQNIKWKKRIGNHEFTAFLAHENQQLINKYESVSATRQLSAGNSELVNYASVNGVNGYSTTLRTESYMTRMLCNYLNRYYIEFSGRRDGSSRFSRKGRWGDFYALGLSYVMSEEEWFKLNPIAGIITDAKFRLNYGKVGNDRSASLNASRDLYQMSNIASHSAAYRSQIGNSDLQWEKVGTVNTGFDLKLWNRWQVTFDAYFKQSSDLIFDNPLPLSTGLMTPEVSASSPTYTINLGRVRNYGLEFQTDAEVYRGPNSRLNVGMSLTYTKNHVCSMPGNAERNGIIRSNGQIIALNEPLFTWYLPEYVGVNTQNGRALYSVDTDRYNIINDPDKVGNGMTAHTSDINAWNDPDLVCIDGVWYSQNMNKGYTKRVKSGSVMPTVYGALFSRYSWKKLSVNLLVNYSLGGKVLDQSYMNLMAADGTSMKALHKDIHQSWVFGQHDTTDPQISTDIAPAVNYTQSMSNNGRSTRFLTNASYLALRRLQLVYDLPQMQLDRLGIKQLSFNLTGENLFTLTARRGMDPTQNTNATGLNGVIGDTSSTLRLFSLGLTFKL